MAGALGGGLAHHLLSTSHSTVLGSSGGGACCRGTCLCLCSSAQRSTLKLVTPHGLCLPQPKGGRIVLAATIGRGRPSPRGALPLRAGAIAGLFAAFVVYKYRNRHYVGFSEQDRNWVLQMVAINVLLALMFSGSLAHM